MSEIEDILAMEPETWRERLAAGIAKSGKSQREISLAADMGPGYVNSILKDGKDPTVPHLISVCKHAGISLSYVLWGKEISAENEQIALRLESADPEIAGAILTLLDSQPVR